MEILNFIFQYWIWFLVGAGLIFFFKLEDGRTIFQAIMSRVQQKPQPQAQPAQPIFKKVDPQPEPVVEMPEKVEMPCVQSSTKAMGITLVGQDVKKLTIENEK